MSSALDGLVAAVVLRVVVLVCLEQVVRTQTVALLQETLWSIMDYYYLFVLNFCKFISLYEFLFIFTNS